MAQLSIKQLELGPMMNFAYLVADAETKLCAVLDPGWDAPLIVDEAAAAGWKIDKILLTHAHFDHAGAIEELARLTDAPIYLHREEPHDLSMPVNATEEGGSISVGGIVLKCMHTPGHTPGSQCFLVPGAVFTGDTLFVDGCGRVDLPGGDPRKMIASLARLARLEPTTIVYPGHDYGGAPSATIGELLKSNPYLKADSEEMLL